jgi:hypothetical protein
VTPASAGAIAIVESTPWSEQILFDRTAFARALGELGFDQEMIEHELLHYDDATAPLRRPNRIPRGMHFKDPEGAAAFLRERARQTLRFVRERLSRLVVEREYRERGTLTTELRVPVFLLRSPPTTGSKVTYKEATSDESSDEWSLTFWGTGMGASTTVTVKYSVAFSARDGQCKLVFAPLKVRVRLIEVYENGKAVSQGLRSELIVPRGRDRRLFARGVMSVPPTECQQPEYTELSDANHYDFLLAQDTSGDAHPAQLTWKCSGSVDVQLGIEAFDLAVAAKVSVKREREIELTCELPAGRDYRLFGLRHRHGIAWQVSGPDR